MTIEISSVFTPSKIVPHLVPLAKHNSALHGVAHWTRVHRYGLLLADTLELSSTQKIAIALFGWTHDLARTNDGGGNQHSIDGADYVVDVTNTLFSNFPRDTLDIVRCAIYYHSDGMTAEEALYQHSLKDNLTWSRDDILNTLGCCWDADRLDLLRLGIAPQESKMSTPYWDDVLPLAAKLNKMTSLFKEKSNYELNENEWFT